MSGNEHTATETQDKIYLTLLNGTGYVFSVDDYMRLREKHRIIGALVGTNSTRGWSVNESTLPVELTPCETRLLLEQGLAELVSKQQSLLSAPTPQELQDYKEKQEARITEQADALKAEKLRETARNMDKIMRGKRTKLLKEGVSAADIQLEPAAILKEIGDNLVFERRNALLEIPCAHAQSHTAQIVKLPADTSLKYRVFRDFWLRGNCVTCGDAFGADFLIYPGDPLLYHASHIVILLATAKLKPLELIAKARLAVIVNKICLLAYFDESSGGAETDERVLCYQTLLWEGNRDKEKPCSTSKLKNT